MISCRRLFIVNQSLTEIFRGVKQRIESFFKRRNLSSLSVYRTFK